MILDNGSRTTEDLGVGIYLAQFNKSNRKFITVMDKDENSHLLNREVFLYHEVNIDPSKQTILGNYDDYEIVNIQDQPVVITEDLVNEFARDKIIEKYPIEKQLNLISESLILLSAKLDVELPEIENMKYYIDEVLRINNLRKEAYANNPEFNYKTTEDLDKEMEDILEGNITEYGGL